MRCTSQRKRQRDHSPQSQCSPEDAPESPRSAPLAARSTAQNGRGPYRTLRSVRLLSAAVVHVAVGLHHRWKHAEMQPVAWPHVGALAQPPCNPHRGRPGRCASRPARPVKLFA